MTHRQTIVIALVLVAVLGAMSIALGTVNQSGGEVRINAKRHEDGRTEFALQQRTADGWSERIAPRGRYLPAEPPVGRWLNSTPIEIAGAAPERPQLVLTEDTLILVGGTRQDTGFTITEDLFTATEIVALFVDTDEQDWRLEIACGANDYLDISLTGKYVEEALPTMVTWRIDSGEAHTEEWYGHSNNIFGAFDTERLLEALYDAERAIFIVDGFSGAFRFDIHGLMTTDAQPLFEACLKTLYEP